MESLKLGIGKNENDFMTKAEQIWSMLDDMAENDADSYKKFVEKTLKEGKQTLKESVKPPEANMCVKAKLISPKQILYINIFAWSKVPAPETNDKPIPVYGKKVEHYDTYSLVNMAFNPKVLDESKSDQARRQLASLAVDYVQNQNDNITVVSDDFEILPKSAHYGNLNDCISKLISLDNKKADDLAEDLAGSSSSKLPTSLIDRLSSIKLENKNPSPTVKPPVLIQELTPESAPISYEEKLSPDGQSFDIRVHLPANVKSISDCRLFINDDNTLILNIQNHPQLDIPLAKHGLVADEQSIQAKLIKKENILKIKINLKKS